jgi:hypothetical protein
MKDLHHGGRFYYESFAKTAREGNQDSCEKNGCQFLVAIWIIGINSAGNHSTEKTAAIGDLCEGCILLQRIGVHEP